MLKKYLTSLTKIIFIASVSHSIFGTDSISLSKHEISCIETKIGYTFKDKKLLQSAFQHSSINKTPTSFKQLAYLGDRVVNMCVVGCIFPNSAAIAQQFPIAEVQHTYVSKIQNNALAEQYRQLKLDSFLKINPGSEGGKIHADAFEALIGAIYLDGKINSDLMNQHPFSILHQIISSISAEIDAGLTSLPVSASQTKAQQDGALLTRASHRVISKQTLALPKELQSADSNEAEIEKTIQQHPKWRDLSTVEQRKRALQCLQNKQRVQTQQVTGQKKKQVHSEQQTASRLPAEKNSAQVLKKNFNLVLSPIVECYSSQSLSQLTTENLNSELLKLKSKLDKGLSEHESTSARLVIQLLEQEMSHRKILNAENDKLKKLEAELRDERMLAQRVRSNFQHERWTFQEELSKKGREIDRLQHTLNSLRSDLVEAEAKYTSLRDANIVGRIFRRK